MKLKLWQKNALSMLTIVVIGFILFNVAFILAWLVSTAYSMAIMPFAKQADGDFDMIHSLWRYVYLILIILLSWFVFRSQFNDLVKATFLTLPLVVILAVVGVQFYTLPVLVYVISAMIIATILFYLYKTKHSWLYYFATLYVAVVMLVVMLSGMQI
jgi:hypothetical protein